MAVPVLTPRALNRALLARQLLLERSHLDAVDAVRHLVGLQAQAPLAPYVGLWSRLRGFTPDDLAAPLKARAVTRATLMRGTVHLVTAEDALRLRPWTEPAIVRGFAGGFSARLTTEQTEAVLGLGQELLAAAPRTRAELR
ncbi:MAG: crosslink repair DNA glycosylase YcaQ family protein, partial [Rhodoglobus sp.]